MSRRMAKTGGLNPQQRRTRSNRADAGYLFDEIIRSQKNGVPRGLTSICSSHPWVLKAAMSESRRSSGRLLIESTCNQVNQFGGYTGMTPAGFGEYLRNLALAEDFEPDRLILGGDHLGPSPWQKEPAKIAMQKAAVLVRDCVRAGYTKLHLDASMRLGDDDPSIPLDLELCAHRTAELAKVAEETLGSLSEGTRPSTALRFVVGSEVPIPGGATNLEKGVSVTRVEDARRSLETTRRAFMNAGLESAWERVVAMVVQPGVEFGDGFILDYDPAAARALKRFAETTPLVFEAHSTDYQSEENLSCLVRDHFAILKVGPALTFAFREAVFGLAHAEAELFPRNECSRLVQTLDQVMLRNPVHWREHYHGTRREIAFARKYSLSDRSRYYWSDPQVQAAFGRLMRNLGARPLPLTLLSQYLSDQAERVRAGEVQNTPEALIMDKVGAVVSRYARASGEIGSLNPIKPKRRPAS